MSATGGNTLYQELHNKLAAAGQEHALEHWADLSPSQQHELAQDVQAFDFQLLGRIFSASMQASTSGGGASEDAPSPCNDVLRLVDGSSEQREAWRRKGLDMIAQGKVAVLLLAGGQGTRLGSDAPKGCYDIGLPSHKSLFQLQAERLLSVQRLAAVHAAPLPVNADAPSSPPAPPTPPPLRWLIMTSDFTHDATVQHFEDHAYFGLHKSQVTFFRQGCLPCLTEAGKIILSSPSSLAKAPDGNGGLYTSLQAAGLLDVLIQEGIECVDTYCVDNALARLADPLFMGYCADRQAQVGARVVAKAHPGERVGVFARRGRALHVIEYTELPPDQATATDPATGQLLYNWSNICMHYFTTQWLKEVCAYLQQGCAYHVARKVIPSKDGPVQGIKLELFIFDTFPTARTCALMEVDRAAEFAPVKNAPGSASDSPDTARAAVLALGAAWVRAAGGKLPAAGPDGSACAGVEVAPLVSYAGEGLERLLGGRTVHPLWDDALQGK